ncbi:MAG: YdcF family protein [Spirochaetota bacterium]
MFSVSKVMTFLFLPPGLIIVLILITVLLITLALRRGNHSRRPIQSAVILLTLSAVLLYTLSIEPVSELLLRPLERAYPPLVLSPDAAARSAGSISAAAVDAIVVLGAGTVSHSPEEGGHTAPGVETLKRLSFAYRIHRRTGLPIITTGGPPLASSSSQTAASQAGAASEEAGPEALNAGDAMGRYLIALGASPEAVKTERTSRNTYENAARVAEQYGPEKVILVTSAYHMPRSAWIFQQIGIEVRPAPTDYKADADGYNLWSFFPTIGSLDDSYKALHEYVGILYYLQRFRAANQTAES